MDRAAVAYAERLDGQPSSVPETNHKHPTWRHHHMGASEKLSMGSALRASSTRRSKFIVGQKNYLRNRLKLGGQARQKADPASFARAMVSAKDASGNHLFRSDDFLSAS